MINRTPPQNDVSDLPLSDAERFKRESNFLRGTIALELDDTLTGGFSSDNSQLIRPHGMYQQDDRDQRAARTEQKLEPLITMMLRCRLPGGIITPQQWLAIDSFSREETLYGSIRLTTRQTFQFHGIFKRDLKSAHQLLHKIGLDSIATAGTSIAMYCVPVIRSSQLFTNKLINGQLKFPSYYCLKPVPMLKFGLMVKNCVPLMRNQSSVVLIYLVNLKLPWRSRRSMMLMSMPMI